MSKSNVIYGMHAIKAILEQSPERVLTVIVQSGRVDKRLQEVIQLAKHSNCPIESRDKKYLDKLSKEQSHQGIMAEIEALSVLSEHDLAHFFQPFQSMDKAPLILILDGVTDPHNLGACFRSADAAGVDLIICPKDRAVSITPVVEKVACGAVQTIPFMQVTNLARTLQLLKEHHIWLYGTSDKAEQSIYQTDFSQGGIALVMGAEGKGIRRLTAESCDFLISIPMMGNVSSLNISVAAGVCLFEILRQTRFESGNHSIC